MTEIEGYRFKAFASLVNAKRYLTLAGDDRPGDGKLLHAYKQIEEAETVIEKSLYNFSPKGG